MTQQKNINNEWVNITYSSTDQSFQDGTTTVWFDVDGYQEEQSVWGVVYENTNDPVLVDCDGAPDYTRQILLDALTGCVTDHMKMA